MTTWTIHEVAAACGLTEHEIHKWNSRGLYRPSEATRRGRYRRYDWRDLACLAVFAELRVFDLPLEVIGPLVTGLRDHLSLSEEFGGHSGVYLIEAHGGDGRTPGSVLGPLNRTGLAGVLDREPRSLIVVDAAKVYRDVLARMSGLKRTP